MNTVEQVVILSAERSELSFESNRQRSINLASCIEELGLRFREATGVYKGVEETSFVVIVRDNTEVDVLKDFAFKNFGQESILHQDSNQEAHLIYNDGKVERLGRLEQVSEEEALKQDSFTIMGNKFYTTVPR